MPWLQRLAVSILLALSTVGLASVPSQALTSSAFIERTAEWAQIEQQTFGVPASVSIAQAMLESGFGESTLTREANNWFGIKCFSHQSPYQLGCYSIRTLEYDADGNPYYITADFRAYTEDLHSFLDHGYFLDRLSRYEAAFDYVDDPDQFIREVHAAGYATDPNYSNKVINLMERYNLYRFDHLGPFTDVAYDDPFGNEITWMKDMGLATGYSDGSYRPNAPVHRGAMAAFLYRISGSPSFSPPSTSPFNDLNPGDPFYKEITWMQQQEITEGYSDGGFHPHEHIHRGAMAAFLYRWKGSPDFDQPATPAFSDVGTQDRFYREISWMATAEISLGYDDGTYLPGEHVHRGAMAAFLFRADAL